MLLVHYWIYLIRASYISETKYTKCAELFLSSLIKENVCHHLPGEMGGSGIMKKVTNGDIRGRGSKIWRFRF